MSGKEFRMERQRHGLSQRQMSELSGVHPVQIARYEYGLWDPPPQEHDALEKALRQAVEAGP